ncbi:MAG: hypothetical protein HC800_08890 [Phormidesmis sp. RL_2_1]|nr:hypothetical protein [Phormidesmis sp. RL_2_1]
MSLKHTQQRLLFLLNQPQGWPKGGAKVYNALVVFLLIGVVVTRLFQLAEIPTGLYADETSIGYNAALIAQTGLDEHGTPFPIYFRAFGEYKNPIYMYLTALIFKLFGISAFNLRLTSVLFYLPALLLTLFLVSKAFNRNKAIELYTLAGFGFLPVFFMLSRISFEVISQLTWITAANLCIWILFNESSVPVNHGLEAGLPKAGLPKAGLPQTATKRSVNFLGAALCGLILGSSIYTYSTARLLSFLTIISLWVIYLKRENIKTLAIITVMFLASLIPYIVFTLTHPGATTERFLSISYIDDPIPVIEKVQVFVRSLFKYWSPDFLVIHGDPNLRHGTGYGGIVFYVTLVLFGIGLVSLFWGKKLNRFNIFLLVNLLMSPLAAVITSAGAPHALRSVLLGYYLFLISCYGMALLSNLKDHRLKKILMGSVAFWLAIEIIGYQANYFVFYPSKSIEAMESFDVQASLQFAVDQNPQAIVFVNEPRTSYANLEFYADLISNPQNIPITMTQEPVPTADSCLIYHQWNEASLGVSPAQFSEYESLKQPNVIERLSGVKPRKGIMKVRCYEAAQ